MKVRMKVDISGTLNGAPYPARGEVGDLPEVVADKLVAAGLAARAGAPLDDAEHEVKEAERVAKEQVEEAEREAEARVEERPAVKADVETTAAVTRATAEPTVPTKRGPGRPRGPRKTT